MKTNQEQKEFNKLFSKIAKSIEGKSPIYKGCKVNAGLCFCTGECKEVIGYQNENKKYPTPIFKKNIMYMFIWDYAP